MIERQKANHFDAGGRQESFNSSHGLALVFLVHI